MSDGTTPTIDPRFDPRFQRGYVPDASSPPHVDHVTPGGTRTTSPARADAAGVVANPAADDPATDDPAAAILELLEYAEAERLVSSGRDDPVGAEFAAAAATPSAAAAASTADPAAAAMTGVDIGPDDGSAWGPTRWLWIAIGACLVFVVAGSVLYWIQASDQSMYMGGGSAGVEETTRMVVTVLSPALVQAGVIGIVAVLVAWAVRGVRHAERPR